MTVAELRESLAEMPDDAVILYDDDGEYWTPTKAYVVNVQELEQMRICSWTGGKPAVLVTR